MQATDVADLIRRVQPTIVFNLAGYGVDPAERDVSVARRINEALPAQLAQRGPDIGSGQWDGQRLHHSGSALEYGTAKGDLREDTVCTPTTLYGSTKLAGTTAIQRQAAANGCQAVTARLFTVYGPGERPGRLLPALLDTARVQKSLELTDGTQQRDFTYVGDVAEGLLRLGVAAIHAGEIVNLATGNLETVRKFAERAADVIGLDKSLLKFGALPTRSEEMSHDPVSITRLRELTGWVPATSIEAGVRLTLAQSRVPAVHPLIRPPE